MTSGPAEETVRTIAAEAGIPTQNIVALGEHSGWAFAVSVHLGGECATHHPERLSVLRELGRLAAISHTIATVGFGGEYGWPGSESSVTVANDNASWHGFLQDELNATERLERLRELAMLTEKQHLALLATLADVECWDAPPVLNHGDLRLKNVVVNHDGGILGLIDWETAVSSIGPHWDLSIALHDLAIDAKQALLGGYGMPEAEVRQGSPVWRLFNMLNYVPTVECLLEEGDTDALEQMRTRLSGALELYAGVEGS